MTASRRNAERWGRRAEGWAALWLRLKGYRILARRARTPLGEIDLVARRGKTLAFVEVKARADLAQAAAAIGGPSRRRLWRAANLLFARYGDQCDNIRIDVILIAPGRLPRHLEAVIEGDGR